jgi:hypothetical protein
MSEGLHKGSMPMMTFMAGAIFLMCMIAGGANIYYFRANNGYPKRLFLSANLYQGIETNVTTQLLRIAACLTALIFLADSWIRNK